MPAPTSTLNPPAKNNLRPGEWLARFLQFLSFGTLKSYRKLKPRQEFRYQRLHQPRQRRGGRAPFAGIEVVNG